MMPLGEFTRPKYDLVLPNSGLYISDVARGQNFKPGSDLETGDYGSLNSLCMVRMPPIRRSSQPKSNPIEYTMGKTNYDYTI